MVILENVIECDFVVNEELEDLLSDMKMMCFIFLVSRMSGCSFLRCDVCGRGCDCRAVEMVDAAISGCTSRSAAATLVQERKKLTDDTNIQCQYSNSVDGLIRWE